jgi:signal peptidase I
MTQQTGTEERTRLWPMLRSRLGFLAATVLLAIVMKAFLIDAFKIPSASMEGTLEIGDCIFVNKFIYDVRDIKRSDVIVFEFPGERDEVFAPRGKFFVKRCIGLPGDTVAITDRCVRVNGETLLTSALFTSDASRFKPRQAHRDIFPAGAPFNPDYYGPLEVPHRGSTIALSDAHAVRMWYTFIAREGHTLDTLNGSLAIDGVKTQTYTAQRDYLYVLCDNRDNAADSRLWGFVPVENVVGQAVLVYWSSDTTKKVRWPRIGTVVK